jgi:hypothetical protein
VGHEKKKHHPGPSERHIFPSGRVRLALWQIIDAPPIETVPPLESGSRARSVAALQRNRRQISLPLSRR